MYCMYVPENNHQEKKLLIKCYLNCFFNAILGRWTYMDSCKPIVIHLSASNTKVMGSIPRECMY